MARYLGPKHKLCRRVGAALCGLPTCPANRRPYQPGGQGRGRGRPRKPSEYGIRLLEKQKLRHIYGVLERQFRRYYARAQRARGETGTRLLQLLETRLDSVVYRLGFARTMPQARQLVNHGHVLVNGRRVDIPSYQVRPGDVVTIRPRSREIPLVQEAVQTHPGHVPDYLKVDPENFEGTLVRLPARDEIPVEIDETKIVEFYSR